MESTWEQSEVNLALQGCFQKQVIILRLLVKLTSLLHRLFRLKKHPSVKSGRQIILQIGMGHIWGLIMSSC